MIDFMELREYRCKVCGKLLCKGQLNHADRVLEVKCRGCGNIQIFWGEEAVIIEKRSELIKQGLIPDTDRA